MKTASQFLLYFGIAMVVFLLNQNCSKLHTDISTNDSTSFSDIKPDEVPNDPVSKEVDVIDPSAEDCTEAYLKGWKCLSTTVSNDENKVYKIRLSWNRPNMPSRGTAIVVSGAESKVNLLEEAPFRNVLNKLSELDSVRTISLQFIDDPNPGSDWGGCWVHGGGYRSAGSAFNSAILKIINELKLKRGSFLNYLGGSNGTILMAYAISHYGLDQFFDRLVLQMGPILPSLSEACNSQNPASFYINTQEQQNFLFGLFNAWNSGQRSGPSICAPNSEDRMSILGPKTSYLNTHVHVIMGALEGSWGLGDFMLKSNKRWYDQISAKSKTYLLREEMAHYYSYKDVRRFLKLAPNQPIENDTDCIDTTVESCENSVAVVYNKRGCEQTLPPTHDRNVGWERLVDGYYKLNKGTACVATDPRAGQPCLYFSQVSEALENFAHLHCEKDGSGLWTGQNFCEYNSKSCGVGTCQCITDGVYNASGVCMMAPARLQIFINANFEQFAGKAHLLPSAIQQSRPNANNCR